MCYLDVAGAGYNKQLLVRVRVEGGGAEAGGAGMAGGVGGAGGRGHGRGRQAAGAESDPVVKFAQLGSKEH